MTERQDTYLPCAPTPHNFSPFQGRHLSKSAADDVVAALGVRAGEDHVADTCSKRQRRWTVGGSAVVAQTSNPGRS